MSTECRRFMRTGLMVGLILGLAASSLHNPSGVRAQAALASPDAVAEVAIGDLGSKWRSARLPAWIFVDFGRVSWVDQAVLHWSAGLHATPYALYAWNGYGWYPVFARNTGGEAEMLPDRREVSEA